MKPLKVELTGEEREVLLKMMETVQLHGVAVARVVVNLFDKLTPKSTGQPNEDLSSDVVA
jgi:hypothetical protein